jgi:hypothetical protein
LRRTKKRGQGASPVRVFKKDLIMRIRIFGIFIIALCICLSAQAQNSGSCTPFKLISAASTNATSVKNTAGSLLELQASNTNAAARFVKIYDKASAPTVGTDVPKNTYTLPPTTGSVTIVIPNGKTFLNGIALAITGAVGDADATAIAASDVVVNLCYK